eukprot:jgi/Bigna1/66137/fgenesh1_pg.1_\
MDPELEEKLRQVAQLIRENVVESVILHRWRPYYNVFIGSKAVDFMVKRGLSNSRIGAVILGNKLLDAGFLHHVHDHHEFKDGYLFYELITGKISASKYTGKQDLSSKSQRSGMLQTRNRTTQKDIMPDVGEENKNQSNTDRVDATGNVYRTPPMDFHTNNQNKSPSQWRIKADSKRGEDAMPSGQNNQASSFLSSHKHTSIRNRKNNHITGERFTLDDKVRENGHSKKNVVENFAGGDGTTPLHLVAKTGNAKICEAILRQYPENQVMNRSVTSFLDSTDTICSFTPLHYACANGFWPVIELLLRKGCNMQACDRSGNTCLHIAAIHHQSSVLSRLLSSPHFHGNELNDLGQTVLHVALLKSPIHPETVREILQHKFSKYDKQTTSTADEVRQQIGLQIKDHKGQTCLHYAARTLLDEVCFDHDIVTEGRRGDADIVMTMNDDGYDVIEDDDDGDEDDEDDDGDGIML